MKGKGAEAGLSTGKVQVCGHLTKPPTLVGSSGMQLSAESSCIRLHRPGVHTPAIQSLDVGAQRGNWLWARQLSCRSSEDPEQQQVSVNVSASGQQVLP